MAISIQQQQPLPAMSSISAPPTPPPERRLPEGMDAWILGAGISSLTAAVHLIQEAHVPPSRVHILETLSQAGGGSISTGDPVNGYDCRAGGMPPFNDVCMEELLSLVPSKTNPNLTVLEEFHEFWDTEAVKDHPHTRFLTRHKHGLERIDAKRASLGLRDRVDLFMLASKSDKSLGRSRICDHFSNSFFKSYYWMLLSTT